MQPEASRTRDLFGVALVVALVALGLGARRGDSRFVVDAREGEAPSLAGAEATLTLHPGSGRVAIASASGESRVDIDLSLIVDGAERALVMGPEAVRRQGRATLVGDVPIELSGDARETATGSFELRMDPAGDLFTVSLALPSARSEHTYALRVGLAPGARAVFVPGRGDIGDHGTVDARAVVLDDDVHPFAIFSSQGPLVLAAAEPDVATLGARPRLVASGRPTSVEPRVNPANTPPRLDVSVLVGASSQRLWGRLGHVTHAGGGKVTGRIAGATERAHVIALDDSGRPRLRALADPDGRFSVEAPPDALHWIAALGAVHTSAPVHFVPGTAWDVVIDASTGGELDVKVKDADTGEPLVARLVVKGVEGTIDPSFGPDYRGSGAGPLMDILDGEVRTPLPAGKYRVSATKGIEWSIDARVVEITSGELSSITLSPRHVVPTPGAVGCDLHVHARPSFDSPVTPEDRVLSLVSAGVDFAVPTEHNLVGDYSGPLETLRLTRDLATVPGVEITTYAPRFGHFGVFPYPPKAPVPPYRGTTVRAMVAGARRGDPSRMVQVHHPRMEMGIGYFNLVGFDPKGGRIRAAAPFDAIEVYNGYELGDRSLTERVLEDWFVLLNAGQRIAATGSSDSHRIQYQWAGYPRTFALVDPRAAGDTGAPIETNEVVAALKRGRSFVSSGPIVELELASGALRARPGDELPRRDALGGTIRVRAAPWVDVTSVELLAGVAPPGATPRPGAPAPGSVVKLFERAIPSRPQALGPEPGTLEEAQARTLRFEAELALDVPADARWIVAVVRGERRMDDAIPFMPIQPMAFTNPVYLGR